MMMRIECCQWHVRTATARANAITLGEMMARLIHVTLEEAGVLDDYSVFLDR